MHLRHGAPAPGDPLYSTSLFRFAWDASQHRLARPISRMFLGGRYEWTRAGCEIRASSGVLVPWSRWACAPDFGSRFACGPLVAADSGGAPARMPRAERRATLPDLAAATAGTQSGYRPRCDWSIGRRMAASAWIGWQQLDQAACRHCVCDGHCKVISILDCRAEPGKNRTATPLWSG